MKLKYACSLEAMINLDSTLKSRDITLLIKVKESEKVGLKINIQKIEVMASGPIISWHIDGETMEAVTDFIFLDCIITVDCDCSHEIKRQLLLGRKAMRNLDSILKSRDITSPTKVQIVILWFFFSSHVQMRELDHKKGWAPKTWCFQTVVLEKALENPWDFKEIKPVNHKEINPEYSLEGLMLQLKFQYFGHLMQRANSLEKTLMLRKIEDRRRGGSSEWDDWMVSPTQWTWI